MFIKDTNYFNSLRRIRKTAIVSVFIFSIGLPFFYFRKITTGIVQLDIYILWALGIISFIGLIFQKDISRKYIFWPLLALGYMLLYIFSNKFSDSSSIHILITSFESLFIFLFISNMKWKQNEYLFLILPTILLQALIGYFQAFTHKFDPSSIQGEFGNSGYFANFILIGVPPLLATILYNKSIRGIKSFGFILALIVVVILIIFTFSRSAILGMVMSCGFIVWPKINGKIKFQNNSIVFIFWLILALIISSFLAYLVKQDSAFGRINIYRICILVIKDYPLFGVGPGRFSAVYNLYQSHFFRTIQTPLKTQLLATDTYEAFNFVLQLLVEYGILGFGIFIGMALATITLIKRCISSTIKSSMEIGCAGAIVSIFWCGIFSNPFHSTPIWLLLIIILGILYSHEYQKKNYTFNHIWVYLCIGCLNIFIVVYSLKQLAAELQWKKASEFAQIGNFTAAYPLYESAYKNLSANGDFLFNFGAECSIFKKYSLSQFYLNQASKNTSFSNLYIFQGNNFTELHQFNKAEECYLLGIYMVPWHLYPKYQLINLYEQWGKMIDANSWALTTLKYPIKIRDDLSSSLINDLNARYGK